MRYTGSTPVMPAGQSEHFALEIHACDLVNGKIAKRRFGPVQTHAIPRAGQPDSRRVLPGIHLGYWTTTSDFLSGTSKDSVTLITR